MNRSIILLSIFSFLAFATIKINAQTVKGKGPIVSQRVNMTDISELNLGISANVYLTQGRTQSIEIKGQQNIIDLLNKESDGGKWNIEFPRNSKVSFDKKLEIHITLSTIETLNLGGSGSFYGQNKFKNLENVRFNIGGSGSIEFALEAEELVCNIGGSGNMDLEGSANSIEINLGGSGSIKAEDFSVAKAKVNSAGSGSVTIDVSNKLDVSLAGSGGVKYKGDPKIKQTIIGSGKVRSL
jgi:hypothetical protein